MKHKDQSNRPVAPPCHSSQLTRLNRVAGQIEGIKRMIADERHCPEILAQLRAARAALRRVEAEILETHLQHCVAAALASGDEYDTSQKITELKELFQRYDEP